jgi:N-acetylglucosaminyldiphosphoundecaprenol N-acetyl-beta-D-mannosaminyltransferase
MDLSAISELGPCMCIGVGGTLDVLAGKSERAPLWMQRHRLEWLVPVAQRTESFFPDDGSAAFVAAVRLEKRSK